MADFIFLVRFLILFLVKGRKILFTLLRENERLLYEVE